ncbi:MAG TPA: hypothetical protein VJM75_02795, partial [Acidimicrobiales bacterium]|nr:hypothetical protein [Acidimicrobiales bacterium]
MSVARPWRRRRSRPRYSAREIGLALALLAPSAAVFVAFFYRPFLNLLNWGTFESRAGGAFFEDV